MRKGRPCFLAIFCSLTPIWAAAAEVPPVDTAWGTNLLWSDGKAEIAVYEAEQTIYGRARPFEAIFITVKEPICPRRMTKADDPSAPGLVTALKLNMILDIPTPNYRYHFLVCVQARAQNPARLLRQTVSSQEWCGNVYKEFLNAARPQFYWRSYWEKEGSGSRNVRLDSLHPTEEQLFLLIRSLRLTPGLTFDLSVYPPQLTNHALPPEPIPTAFRVIEGEPFDLEGDRLATWRIEAHQVGGRSMVFEVARDFPRPLTRFDSSDGRRLRLKSLERSAYWILNEKP